MTGTPKPAARRPNVAPLVRIAIIIVAAFFVGMLGASRLSSALSSQAIPWDVSVGIGGPAFDRSAESMVVNVEVQWPGCVATGDYSWLTPEVSYMPWSVTITLRTSATYAANPKCSNSGSNGSLPVVGYYLSALSYPVQLSEPLGNRPLFDGSTFPATERYRP